MAKSYIKTCIIGQLAVNIITMNGFQMICKILVENSDNIVVFCDGKKKMVYKHAISTIEPANPKL